MGAAILLGAGLRLHGLLRHPVWLDEAYSVAVARQPLREIARSLVDETGPPLYYLLLHGWLLLFGEGEAAVRLLSVVCGLLLIPATGRLARRLEGPGVGVAAAFLTAVTPIAVQFSQEARMYALLPLLTALAAERLLAWLQEGGRGALLAHALLLTAILYTHNWGLLILPASGAAACLYGRERLRGWVGAALLALLLYAPWIPVLRAQVRDPSYLFIAMVQKIPWWELPFRSLQLFASGAGDTGGTAGPLVPMPLSVLLAAWLLCLLAAPLVMRERRRDYAALLMFGAIPPLAGALYSGLVRPIYLLGRYEILVLPVTLAVACGSLARLALGRRAAIVVAVWAIALASVSLRFTSAIERRFPEPMMASALLPRLRPGDRVVFCGLYRAAMEYHLRRGGASFAPASFPPEAGDHLGWYYEGLYRPDAPEIAVAARSHCPPDGARTWVVATGGAVCGVLIETLRSCASLSSPFLDRGVPANQVLLAEPRER